MYVQQVRFWSREYTNCWSDVRDEQLSGISSLSNEVETILRKDRKITIRDFTKRVLEICISTKLWTESWATPCAHCGCHKSQHLNCSMSLLQTIKPDTTPETERKISPVAPHYFPLGRINPSKSQLLGNVVAPTIIIYLFFLFWRRKGVLLIDFLDHY